MRAIGIARPTDQIPQPPDTVATLLVEGSSGQAMDWPTGADIVRFSGTSTSGAAFNFRVNLTSTKAAAPSSGLSTAGTTGFGHNVTGEGFFQIPGGSTGFSVAALSSGYITAETWNI